MTNLTATTAELVELVGVKLAGELIADAIAFLADKYTDGDIVMAVEGIANTPNGRARFETLMGLTIKATREVRAA